MTGEQAKAAADVILTVWEGEFSATCQVLAAVKEDNRDYKPDPKSRTAWQLAKHIAATDIWFMDSILAGAFDPKASQAIESQFQNVAGLVEYYTTTFPEKVAALRALPGDTLAASMSFFGMFNWPRVQFVGFANNHGIHHRGQLAAYLRGMGSKVPNIYGPSADAEPMPAK